MITLVIANQKGGTGKTTTALALGHKLAMDGYRTLLVDTDAQGHLAAGLGIDKAPGIDRLVSWREGQGTPLIVEARDRLDLIPSDARTSSAKQRLAGMRFREDFLAKALQDLGAGYDVAVIDCAPSVDVLHTAAVVAADWLIVPTRLDYLAVDGVNEVIMFLRDVKQYRDAADLLGILPTFYDRRTNETLEQLRVLVDTFGDLVSPPIPIDVRLREAPAFGQTIWEYAPRTRSILGIEINGKAYGGYARFVDQVKEAAL
jgi:chromosome partitioning protein